MRRLKYRGRQLLGLCCLVFISACDYLPSNSPPLNFGNEILSFDYPKNWKVESGGAPGGLQYVIINGPSSTEVIFQVYPKQGAPTLQQFADWFSTEFQQLITVGEIRKITFSETTKRIGPTETSGIREQFRLTLFGFEVPHTREYFAYSGEDYFILLVFQMPDDGAVFWGDGFRQIQQSLIFN